MGHQSRIRKTDDGDNCDIESDGRASEIGLNIFPRIQNNPQTKMMHIIDTNAYSSNDRSVHEKSHMIIHQE